MPGGSGDYVVRKTREKNIFIGASRFIGKPDLSDLIQAVDDFVLDKKGTIIHK